MHVAIDARMITPGSMHGIARYVSELLRCLAVYDRGHTYSILVERKSPLYNWEFPSYMSLEIVRSPWFSLGQQWEFPSLLKKLKVDVFHATSFMAPLSCPCHLIMTIHDLNHMVLPHFYTPFHQFYYQMFVRSSIKRSSYVLTVSEFSKQEIVNNFKIPAEKIWVTYNGVSNEYQPINDLRYRQYVRDIYELPDRFIFCLSNNKPHKNISRLVSAFCHADLNIPLVLTCPVDKSLLELAESYDKKHLIHFAKFIREEHLPSVYSMTDLFVFPSTYEGFGLPPLEALSCGAPVVVARSSSLPEVVGDSAVYTNPYDFRDMAHALEQACSDQKLRTKLRENGLKQAQRFTWEAMTSRTLQAYEACLPDSKIVRGSQEVI